MQEMLFTDTDLLVLVRYSVKPFYRTYCDAMSFDVKYFVTINFVGLT